MQQYPQQSNPAYGAGYGAGYGQGGPGYAQQQMQPQQQMQIQVNHKNPKSLPINSKGERHFDAGVCGCFSDMGKCCLSCWCPCIAYGKNKKRFESLDSSDSPARDVGCCTSGGWCYFLLGFCGLACCLDCGLRGDIRKRYQIEGGACGDFCVSCCCHICNQVQQSKELEAEEESILRGVGLGKR